MEKVDADLDVLSQNNEELICLTTKRNKRCVCLPLPLSERGAFRVLGRQGPAVRPWSSVGSWWSRPRTGWGRPPPTPPSTHWCARLKAPTRSRRSYPQCLRCWCRHRTTFHPAVTSQKNKLWHKNVFWSRDDGAAPMSPTCACLARSLFRMLVASKPALSHSCRGMISSALA